MTEHSNAQDGSQRIEVLIVDDHSIFRQGIQMNLDLHADIEVIGQCSNGPEALQTIMDKQPAVVLLDINIPGITGIQVTRQLVAERVPTRVVLMTGYDDAEQVIHAMRAGAAAYCAKEISPDKLVEVIRLVMGGHYVIQEQVFDRQGLEDWLSSGVEAIAGQYYADLADTFSPLSPREMEILQFVTHGLSNKEIARALQISHQTVKNHMTSILRKLAVEDRTQAAVFALRRGWVRLRETGSKEPDDE